MYLKAKKRKCAEGELIVKRVLCILSNMNSGGAETFLMKLYRKLNRTKYQMDFCLNTSNECFYSKEIRELGGRTFFVPPKSAGVAEFKKQLSDLVKKEGYKYVLRITSNAAGFMDLKIAKGAGAQICSARSSNSSDGVGFKAKIIHRLSRVLYGKYVDVKFAPSDLAAEYTFGKRAVKAGKISTLHNAVDLNVYHYYPEERVRLREEFGVDDCIVVGHVGRFAEQKNHMFLLDIFTEIKKQNDNAVLLLVGGNGNLEEQVRGKVAELGLEESVIFTGIRSDIPQLMSAMDVFVMPSLFEGMPNTVIEAQATGLPCVIADTITKEANITGLVEYLPLREPQNWAQKALLAARKQRADTKQAFIDNKYDIESTVQNFVELVFGE